MFTLRCTARLRKRLGMTQDAPPTPPSTKLGDWYAHLLFTRPQLVLCVSERTLLPVLVPARDGSLLVARLRDAAGQMLAALGVADAAVASEQETMMDAVIGQDGEPASSRLDERLRADARLVPRGRNAPRRVPSPRRDTMRTTSDE